MSVKTSGWKLIYRYVLTVRDNTGWKGLRPYCTRMESLTGPKAIILNLTGKTRLLRSRFTTCFLVVPQLLEMGKISIGRNLTLMIEIPRATTASNGFIQGMDMIWRKPFGNCRLRS